MATVTIKHGTLTGAAADPTSLVDGPKWDAAHTVTGLENVDNTSDANKPVSTAQAAADALKANIASPTFTGIPAAPTPAANNNSTQIATTAYVDGADATRDTAIALKAPLASPTFTGTPAAPTAAAGVNTTQVATTANVLANIAAEAVRYDAAQALTTAQRAQARSNISVGLKGALFGLTLSTAGASATFGVAAGEAADSTGVDLMVLLSAYTKTTGSWAVGTGNGGLDTGVIANNTWYHGYLIKRPDTDVVDPIISLSATAPTLPTNYTLFRRIGSMKTNGSAQWTAFSQLGDEFLWLAPVQDMNNVATSLTATLVTLTVPTGIQVGARLLAYGNSGTGTGTVVNSPDETSVAGGSLLVGYSFIWPSGGQTGGSIPSVRTNTSAQVRVTSTATGAFIYLLTEGWTDRRGRDA